MISGWFVRAKQKPKGHDWDMGTHMPSHARPQSSFIESTILRGRSRSTVGRWTEGHAERVERVELVSSAERGGLRRRPLPLRSSSRRRSEW